MRLLRWLLSPFLGVAKEEKSFAEATTKKAHGTTDQWHADGPLDTCRGEDTTVKLPVLRDESGKGDQP